MGKEDAKYWLYTKSYEGKWLVFKYWLESFHIKGVKKNEYYLEKLNKSDLGTAVSEWITLGEPKVLDCRVRIHVPRNGDVVTKFKINSSVKPEKIKLIIGGQLAKEFKSCVKAINIPLLAIQAHTVELEVILPDGAAKEECESVIVKGKYIHFHQCARMELATSKIKVSYGVVMWSMYGQYDPEPDNNSFTVY